jgi:putative lipase involved disintegration of autophagic bodies
MQDFGADAEPIYAHAGFLNAANDLEPVLTKKIKEILVYNEVKHVLFTGHSAGGAVASLLFAKYLFRAKSDGK